MADIHTLPPRRGAPLVVWPIGPSQTPTPEEALCAALDAYNGHPSTATLLALDEAAINCGMDPDYHGQGSVAAWAMRHLWEARQ